MNEVAGAVIATSLVLVAVFVPVAFFPGHDRHSVSPVCADHRIFHRHLGLQRADADARRLSAILLGKHARTEGLVLPQRSTR